MQLATLELGSDVKDAEIAIVRRDAEAFTDPGADFCAWSGAALKDPNSQQCHAQRESPQSAHHT